MLLGSWKAQDMIMDSAPDREETQMHFYYTKEYVSDSLGLQDVFL